MRWPASAVVCSFNVIVHSSSITKWTDRISWMVWHRITKFHGDIGTGLVYKHTGYDVTNYFRSEVVIAGKKLFEMPPWMQTISVWMCLWNLVILAQTVFKIFEELISRRTNEHWRNLSQLRAKRNHVSPKIGWKFCLWRLSFTFLWHCVMPAPTDWWVSCFRKRSFELERLCTELIPSFVLTTCVDIRN